MRISSVYEVIDRPYVEDRSILNVYELPSLRHPKEGKFSIGSSSSLIKTILVGDSSRGVKGALPFGARLEEMSCISMSLVCTALEYLGNGEHPALGF